MSILSNILINFRFEELLFKLPDTNGYAPGKKPVDISDEQIKFAVHPSYGEPMVAMAAVKYSELKVLVRMSSKLRLIMCL